MKKIFLFSFLSLMLQVGMLSAQENCIMWFEGPGAQPLGLPHQGCAPCGTPVTYTLKFTGDCNSACTNLFMMEATGGLHIDNATSYTILNQRTISITWGCGDPAGVIYVCGSDLATAVRICQGCESNYQYCLKVSCDTLCVFLASQPNTPIMVSSPDNTSSITCFNSPIVAVEQYPCHVLPTRTRASGSNIADDEDSDQFAIPNPANDHLMLKIPSYMQGKNSIRVVGVNGKLMYSTTTEEAALQMSTVDWPAGIYQVQISNEMGEVHQKVTVLR